MVWFGMKRFFENRFFALFLGALLLLPWCLSCQSLDGGVQKSEQTPVLTEAEFKAFSTLESPRQIWSSKARVMALGGRVPYYQVPSAKVLFGLSFEQAKKLVRLIDTRDPEKSSQSPLQLDENVKAPLVSLPWTVDYLGKQPLPPTIQEILRDGDVKSDSIIILLCTPEWNPQDIARTLKLNGFLRVLIQRC